MPYKIKIVYYFVDFSIARQVLYKLCGANSKKFTALTVPDRSLYQFRLMPFGLCNAAQPLCRLMDYVVPHRLRSHVFVYLDDLLVVASDFDTHYMFVEKVADSLKKANLTIGMKKLNFCFKQLRYLGFIVDGGNIRTDPEKIAASCDNKDANSTE